MKNRIERNFDVYTEIENEKGRLVLPHRLSEASNEQKELTEKFLLPYEEEILKDAIEIRSEVDRLINVRKRDLKRDTQYPIGYCGEITKEFLNQLNGRMHDRSKIGLTAIKNFVRAGGIISHFWSINKDGKEGDTFQNALQLGGSVLDVAQDTLDGRGQKVEFFGTVEESPLIPIDSYEEAAEVAESYWGDTVFPNTYLPELAPIYPVLLSRPLKDYDGKDSKFSGVFLADYGILSQMSTRDFMTSDQFERRMGHAYRFLTESKYAKRRIPAEYVTLSEKYGTFLKSLKETDHEAFKVSFDPDRIEDTFSRFYAGSTREIFREQIKDATNIRDLGEHFTSYPLFIVPTTEIEKAIKNSQKE